MESAPDVHGRRPARTGLRRIRIGRGPVILYRDREDAAMLLAERLRSLGPAAESGLVLAIPRGGVATGAVLSRELGFDLDLVLSRRLRASASPHQVIGGIAEDGSVYFVHNGHERGDLDPVHLDAESRVQRDEIERMRSLFRGNQALSISGRSIILTDDGMVTGSRIIAALQFINMNAPRLVIVAVPIASAQAYRVVRRFCDDLICPQVTAEQTDIGRFYADFPRLGDARIGALLAARLLGANGN